MAAMIAQGGGRVWPPFLSADGVQMAFYMPENYYDAAHQQQREAVRVKVLFGGGRWLTSPTDVAAGEAVELILPKDETAARVTLKPKEVRYRSQFVDDCMSQGKLLDLKPYSIRRGEKVSAQKRSHVFFTPSDDVAIVKHVEEADPKGPSINGAKFWQGISETWGRGHTWQSLKQRYKAHIKPALEAGRKFTEEEDASPVPSRPAKRSRVEGEAEASEAGEKRVESSTPSGAEGAPAEPVIAAKEDAAVVEDLPVELTEGQKERLKQVECGVKTLQTLTSANEGETLQALIAASGNFLEAQKLLEQRRQDKETNKLASTTKGLGVAYAGGWTEDEDKALMEGGGEGRETLLAKRGEVAVALRQMFLMHPVRADPSEEILVV
eukprot:TRINITY_DN19264_c0_g1_i1.p1 TRINITY_DN19264_c0_g1~~TRINITY_DN19264_c0_g1_i1.p1  ORF type:complete len:381 (-),score=102.37 TRINITY_DN19264_c0_g1_i1:114-1256(-)